MGRDRMKVKIDLWKLSALAAAIFVLLAAGATDFKLCPWMKGSAKGELKPIPGGFLLSMEGTPDSEGFVAAGAKPAAVITPDRKLTFRWRGGANNQLTTLGIYLSVRNQKTGAEIFKAYRVGSADGTEWRTTTLEFGRKFGLPDGTFEIPSLRFILSGKDNPQVYSSVEITDIAFIDQEDQTLLQGDFLVVPAPRKAPKAVPSPAGFQPVKVFFDFDNNDFGQLITARNQKPVYEKTDDAGFRDLVLTNCGGIIRRVDAPDTADVIVYSRAAKGTDGPAIAGAVRRGAGLISYGDVPDPEVAALLPAGITARKLDGPAEREPVLPSELPLFGGIGFNDVDFGIYLDLTPRSGGETVLAYAGGKPMAVGKGKVLQFGVGIGSTLLPSSVFYDKLLLHCILWYGSKTPEQALKTLAERERTAAAQTHAGEREMVESVTDATGISQEESRNYRRGMSWNNIGRFGYLIEEGLPCDNLDPSLKVVDAVKNIQSYTFDVIGKEVVPLERWQVKRVAGEVRFDKPGATELGASEIWHGLGKVEYRCQLEIKPEWKGKLLLFEVKKGISDCDETYFNGRRIGAVDSGTPAYWDKPRRYLIPADAVRWGEKNDFRVVIENLHGGACFNSRPELVVTNSGKDRKLEVTDLNWISKQYRIFSPNGTHRLWLSQVIPFILYDFSQSKAEMNVENVAEYAAYATAGGIKVADLEKQNVFYDLERDGKLAAPWILLFRSGKTSPLLVALSHNPVSVRAECSRGAAEKLVFDGNARPLGEIVVGRPWGITPIETSGWTGSLPDHVRKKIAESLNFAFNFPMDCDEIYRIDRERQRVDIVNRFRFHRVKDEWDTACSPYAVLPPLTAFAVRNNLLGSTPEKLSDFGMKTKFGPLLGTPGKSTIRYSLPLPDTTVDPVLPRIAGTGNEFFEKEINECTVAACQWSFRNTRADALTPARPFGTLESFNIDPFAWGMGMGVMLEGYYQLNDTARQAADRRIRKRILEPMDLYRYKYFDSSRVEPFSGIEYTVNFRSVYPNPVKYAPGFGSKIMFGDSNEAYAQIGWIAVMMADRFGCARQVRNAWPHYKYLARYNERVSDWAFHSSSCRESGIGGWADMLNCEYPALYYLARLAEIAGDRDGADDALYRTAKSMVPTLARLDFGPYLHENGLVPENRKIAAVLGFNEYDGARHLPAPLKSDRYLRDAVYLFDFSQGFPGAMSNLYQRQVRSKIRNYLSGQAIPALLDKDGKFISTRYLTVLAQFCDEEAPLEKYAVDAVRKGEPQLRLDRGGYHLGCELGNVLAWKYKAPRLQHCREVMLTTCSFEVRSRQLTLVFTGGPEAEVVIPAPRSLTINGKEFDRSAWRTVAAGVSLPVAGGVNRVIAQY